MAASLDSEHVFSARMHSLGLDATLAQELVDAGVTSMSKLAFICGVQPGVTDDKPFVQAIYDVLQRDSAARPIPTMQVALLRRLWFESHTCVMAEVKHKLEQTEESLPKKLPLVEREARRKLQVAKLTGVDLTGILEPAHSLIDYVWSLRESDTLKYVDPSKCGSRESEIKGQKKEQFLRTDTSGRLVTYSKELVTSADTSNEYRLRLALQRRSLALDQVDILPYAISERYHDEFFALTMRQVPSSHSPISINQLMEADRTVWARCAQLCRDGLAPTSGVYPLEEALRLAKVDPVVISILQPMLKATTSNREHRTAPYQKGGGKGSHRSKFESRGKGDGNFQYSNSGFRDSGKGKGGKKGKRGWLPPGLKGNQTTRNGERICFAYNLQTCGVNGNKCEKGLHVCTLCNEAHPFSQCTKRN